MFSMQDLRPASGFLLAALMSWAAPGLAQQSACVNDSADKMCVQLTAQPDQVVQASRLDGASDTFVYYTANITGVSRPTSSRLATVTLTLTPAVDIVDFSSTSGQCSVSGAALSCTFDKLTASNLEVLRMTAKAPQFAGAATPATLVNSGVFGWQGRTATVSNTLAVSTSGGYSWVPPNTSVTLVTAPEASDPSTQTTAESPLWAKMIIPARATGFLAYLAINDNTSEDFSQACSAGLFHSGNSDGGPYVCRDIGAPFDAGMGSRWVETSVDDAVDGTFTDTPIQYVIIWDDSIVSPAQLMPTPVTPTGTPPLAVFYRADAATDPIRAYSNACGANQPPCLSDVQLYGTNDWTATLQLSLVNNGGAEADPLLPPPVTNLLASLMEKLVNLARASGLPPPVIIR